MNTTITETTTQTDFEFINNIQIIVETEPQMRLVRKWRNPLKLVAYQNHIRLNNPKGYNKAVRIFKQSILNN